MTYFRVTVPCDQGAYEFVVSTGNSLIIVGANGSGKTRLAVHIEEQGGESCHRISAHRALKLNAAVPKISENEAKKCCDTELRRQK